MNSSSNPESGQPDNTTSRPAIIGQHSGNQALKPDPILALKFMERVIPTEYDGFLYGCTKVSRNGKLNQAFWGHTNDIETFVERAIAFEQSVYVTPAMLRANIKPHGHIKNTDVVAINHLKVELDSQKAFKGFADKASICRPTMIVTTGTTPWRRMHTYWCFSEALEDLDVYKSVQRGFAKLFEGDNIPDPRRLMRLPGTINRPTSEKQDRGYVDELITVEFS